MGIGAFPMTPEEEAKMWETHLANRSACNKQQTQSPYVANKPIRVRKRPPVFPIGTHGLRGSLRGDLITIAGPCGEGHIMSREAAKELEDWLHRILAT